MPHWDWLSVFVPSARDKFTVKELQRLHRILLRQVTCPGAGSAEEYVEALRSMAELVIWYVTAVWMHVGWMYSNTMVVQGGST